MGKYAWLRKLEGTEALAKLKKEVLQPLTYINAAGGAADQFKGEEDRIKAATDRGNQAFYLREVFLEMKKSCDGVKASLLEDPVMRKTVDDMKSGLQSSQVVA